MLNHLRFLRGTSNPSSPLRDQAPSWDAALIHEHPQTTEDVSPRPRSANASRNPPTLPPIARVTSSDSESSFGFLDSERPEPQPPRPAPTRQEYNGGDTGFIGGVALQNYRRGSQGQVRPESTAEEGRTGVAQAHIARSKPAPPPIYTGASLPRPTAPAVARAPDPMSSFITPTDRQQFPDGMRPSGMRLAGPESNLRPVISPNPEPSRSRKGIPFLKNPMSNLLMRRKTSQYIPDSRPVQFDSQGDQVAYDPRIRGTRFHDFGAPKPRKLNTVSGKSTGSDTLPESSNDLERAQTLTGSTDELEFFQAPGGRDGTTPVTAGTARDGPGISGPSRPGETASNRPSSAQQDARRLSLDKPLPKHPSVRAGPSFRSSNSSASSTSSRQAATLRQSTPSTRTVNSRNVSLSGAPSRKSTLSALPKHMTSTSSRFSFDMMGAANQEKLLEERHRQRELEKQTTAVDTGPRDSRFDDFDEDGFDYDAMMDDDGLEERIPGVNADAEDDEFDYNAMIDDGGFEESIPGVNTDAGVDEDVGAGVDPDDDQENFAGFVFQRSNPQSSLASPYTPGMVPTPRDANGKVIGFAMTKDTTPGLPPSDFMSGQNLLPELDVSGLNVSDLENAIDGLYIQGLDTENRAANVATDATEQPQASQTAGAPRPPPKYEDDIYFDDGLADELTFEPDGEKFDESLFDLNDTDQYGRPIPGAFAKAQQLMSAKREASKRESDSTSRLSAQSMASPSTAHTSVSVEPMPPAPTLDDQEQGSVSPQGEVRQPQSMPVIPVTDQDIAYQAALVEATHLAAASGKFRRGSSPTTPADVRVTSPTDSSESPAHAENPLDDYENDDYPEGMDDYDFDDDAIIAEANASALANDDDGFYGQEFGFYSAPINQPHPSHGHVTSSSSTSSTSSHSAKPLSTENLFQYANGGFFGPAGDITRSMSGRIVSREPNLTPITERSEYSNRNSFMLPSVLGSAGGSAGAIQSPGLVELAMMPDAGENISMDALRRLRSRAWGGSQASLASSREGSPMSERGGGFPGDGGTSPLGAGSGVLGGLGSGLGHARKNSAFSLWSNSDAGSGAGSPTLTMSMANPLRSSSPPPQVPAPAPSSMFPPPTQPHRATSPTARNSSCLPVPEGEEMAATGKHFSPTGTGQTSLSGSGLWLTTTTSSEERDMTMSPSSQSVSSPQSTRGRPSGMGHRHKGSADSISYRKEEDSGETRWVMERRRMDEAGGEILEREVVEGGRI